MADLRSTERPLEAVAGAAGPDAPAAFALLGNRTRLAALLALWEEYDPETDDDAVPFSRVLDRVDTDDPGNLRYHLEELRGQFVRQDGDRGGYELRPSGLTLVRAVVAGVGVRDATREPTEIDEPCPLCGGPTAIRYRDGVVVWNCTVCEGPAPGAADTDGFLSAVPFDPAGLTDRTAAELRAASWVASRRQVRAMFDGLCPACSGPVTGRLDCCGDHDPSPLCGDCGSRFAAWARFRCRVCKNHAVDSPKRLALFHPAVVALYDAHGRPPRTRADDPEGVRRVFALVDDHDLEVVSTSPPRAAVVASAGGDEVRVIFDETATVDGVRR